MDYQSHREPVSDFSFVHISDEHIYHDGSQQAIVEIGQLKRVELQPYGTIAEKPEFVIDTGDCTEFGVKAGAYETICGFYRNAGIPHYLAVGNHDQTWGALSYEMRKEHGGTYYSFDRHGVHFAILESASLQDPRPAFSPEELSWLQSDLEKVGPDAPVFLAFHHPLNGSEFASSYEVDRLLDVIQPYHIVLMMVGHGHTAEHSVFAGIDMVQGGSPWGGQPGYQLVSIQNGMLRVAYKLTGTPAATIPMLEKSLSAPATHVPDISVISPKSEETVRGKFTVVAQITGVPVLSAVVEIDGATKVQMSPSVSGRYQADVAATSLEPGAHTLRCLFTGADGVSYQHSSCYYTQSPEVDVVWRTNLTAGSKSTLAIAKSLVLVGDNAGTLHALQQRTGTEAWSYKAGGAIVGEPLVNGQAVIVGDDNGVLSSISLATGRPVWKYDCGDPIYSTPVTDGRLVFFGCRSGAFYGVDINTGKPVWKKNHATYCIEAKPFISGDRVIFGAWDCYIYCLDCRDGALIWKCMCKGSAEGIAPAYYSASDAGPVQCGSRVLAADRKYRLSVINARNGVLVKSQTSVSAVSLSADSRTVYTRGTNGKLSKIDINGLPVWSVDAPTDSIPAAPCEKDGVVYVASGKGLVSAFSASAGRLLWSYQATPRMYMFAGVGVDSGVAYVVGSDGMITALRPRR